jgi:hypothetical protein
MMHLSSVTLNCAEDSNGVKMVDLPYQTSYDDESDGWFMRLILPAEGTRPEELLREVVHLMSMPTKSKAANVALPKFEIETPTINLKVCAFSSPFFSLPMTDCIAGLFDNIIGLFRGKWHRSRFVFRNC